MGASLRHLGGSWRLLETSWSALGRSWNALGRLLEAIVEGDSGKTALVESLGPIYKRQRVQIARTSLEAY